MIDRSKLLPAGLVTLVAAGLAIFSQTYAFAWDEGWHLLAAQSLTRGKRLYLDFAYPQTPLNAYWNATWFRLFGDTWRTAHAVSAVMTFLAVLLTADYLRRRFPVSEWRAPAAIFGFLLVSLNVMIFRFGAIGQAYGLCLFMIVAAFRFAVAAVERERPWLAAGAGFCACTATNASLLTAPVAPILLLWMLYYHQRGSRWASLALFGLGSAIPFLPLAWLFAQGPQQTLFNVLDYNMRYRYLEWEGAIVHDIGVMTAWIDSVQALILGSLAIAGLLFVRRSGWERGRRAEFYLCGWLAGAEMVHIARAHPNFERYYMFAVPFLAVLACAGLFAVTRRLQLAPARPILVLGVLLCLGLGKALFDVRENLTWLDLESVAHKVREVTPPGGALLADEQIYFLTRHVPPSGMELEDSHKFNFGPEFMTRMHLVSRAELQRRIEASVFDVIETRDDDKVEKFGLPKLYRQKAEVVDASIFWDKVAH